MYSRLARLLFAAACISCLFSGCGKRHAVMSGGKPPIYWVKNVTSPDVRLRRTAVVKLGNAGNLVPEILPALLGALHDSDPQVRSEAVLALLKAGPEARRAVGELQALAQRDRDAKVRQYAARAVERLR